MGDCSEKPPVPVAGRDLPAYGAFRGPIAPAGQVAKPEPCEPGCPEEPCAGLAAEAAAAEAEAQAEAVRRAEAELEAAAFRQREADAALQAAREREAIERCAPDQQGDDEVVDWGQDAALEKMD